MSSHPSEDAPTPPAQQPPPPNAFSPSPVKIAGGRIPAAFLRPPPGPPRGVDGGPTRDARASSHGTSVASRRANVSLASRKGSGDSVGAGGATGVLLVDGVADETGSEA